MLQYNNFYYKKEEFIIIYTELNIMNELLAFPSELMIFSDRIDTEWQEKLRVQFSMNKKGTTNLMMDDWYINTKMLLSSHKDAPSSLWTMAAKLAWVLADAQFFIENSDLFEKNNSDPHLSYYFGAGIVEFLDFTKGFEIIKNSYESIKTVTKDSLALLDIATSYSIILNNSDNEESLKKHHQLIKKIFEKDFDSNPSYHHLIIPTELFIRMDNEDKNSYDYEEALRITINAKNHLTTALVYSYTAQLNKKVLFDKSMELSIQELKKINAKNRLAIAYTNLANFHANKAEYDLSLKYLDDALTLVGGLPLKEPIAPGSVAYPLIQKARILVDIGELEKAQKVYELALEIVDGYNAPHYLSKLNFGLAHLYFLLKKYSLAYNHTEKAASYINYFHSSSVKSAIQLKYIDLLIELNKLNNVENILENINVKELKNCSQIYYEYIKGKFELARFNLGFAKLYLENAFQLSVSCTELKPTILFTLAEGYLREYKLSGDLKILERVQKMIEEGLNGNIDVPTRTKGRFLTAILLSAQSHYEAAEEIFDEITSSTVGIIPHFRDLASKMLEEIQDSRISSTNISPITNLKDVIRYLRDAKTSVESQPR